MTSKAYKDGLSDGMLRGETNNPYTWYQRFKLTQYTLGNIDGMLMRKENNILLYIPKRDKDGHRTGAQYNANVC